MYLEAIWSISERKEEVKISSIARLLDTRQPIVVQMFHKLNDACLYVELNNGFMRFVCIELRLSMICLNISLHWILHIVSLYRLMKWVLTCEVIIKTA